MSYRSDLYDLKQLTQALYAEWHGRQLEKHIPYIKCDDLARRILDGTPDGSSAIVAYIDAKCAAKRSGNDADEATRLLELHGLRFRLGQLF